MSTLLEVKDITKIYPNQPKPGLDHVSFEVMQGEFLGIMGASAVKVFLLDTDIKMRAKISSLMEILEEYGNLLREPYSKYLRDGIFELRCQSGNNISRILYFFYCDNKIIMTNGFIKKTNKTPKKEIELAKSRKADYIGRMMNK